MTRRNLPWTKLRVIVEVTVPPGHRAREKDLLYAVREAVPMEVKLARPTHANAITCPTRVKGFTRFWPMFLRMERGLNNFRDRNNGL